MASATKTFTFPASQIFVDFAGVKHTINTSQTFVMYMTDDGTTARYTGDISNETVTTTDGLTLLICASPLPTYGFNVTDDINAVLMAGTLEIREPAGQFLWDVTSVAIDDADVPTTCTMTLENRHTKRQMTWTSLTVA